MAFANRTFWSRAYSYFDSHWMFIAFGLGLSCLLCALIIALSVKYVLKPLLIIFFLVAAAASWFMDEFGTVIDIDMLRNAAQTTTAEAGHLITPAFVGHMVLFGILPSLAVCWVRIRHHDFLTKFRLNLGAISVLLLVFVVCAVSGARGILSVTRLQQDLILTLNPIMPIGNAVVFAGTSRANKNIVVQPLGTDARVAALTHTGKPRVLVIVAGETARAENFSLGGYQRETNPGLAKREVTYFSQTTSCGTATSVSIPCMFSNLTRAGYTHRRGLANENVLDVLGHAGITTEWWDNNTGSKAVANRTTYLSYSDANDPRYCKNNECLDEVMVADLDAWLSKVKGDSVLVLHQIGSHGPVYYQRYPEAFAKFKPECRTGELGNCDRDEIVNAYDNTLLYTDSILSSVIDKLSAHQDVLEPAMIYMSDHGESLGERGLYLHGAPYIVAPSQQTHIPFILWQGAEMKTSLNQDCIGKRAGEAASHDNLFHTVLGIMGVQTKVYQSQLDVLASCRKGQTS
jgi:lipid A ethanolaminephosphotransferase